mgnify:FL=1
MILPKDLAYDFLLFTQRNPKSCPLLEVSDVGGKGLSYLGKNVDIYKDIPKYRIYENGELTGEYTDVSRFYREDLVSFLIGCSFSFESELLEAGIPVRHIEEGCNVPMYLTNIPCESAGAFSGNMVVSMRPIPHHLIPAAVTVTAAMPRVHGAPVQIGYPEAIGIKDINKPDFGDMVTIREGEVPGIHVIRYESEADSIILTHDAKNRKGFALGAVLAAEFTANKEGYLGMSDLFPFLK